MAVDGKKNPHSELIATLQGFFAPSKSGDDHPRCRFPARYFWLKEMLLIKEESLPAVSCNSLHERLQQINPQKAVLIFPSPYIRGRGSMFGHTLLRIDGNINSDLLSYAVNYAAMVPPSTSVLTYVYKGVSGGFKGYYSLMPYYAKIKEYNDLEQRDIWEYQLNLDAKEVWYMVLHVMELQDIYSDYRFFGENCSFNLLFLLEAARPSLKLTERYWNRLSFWVIPIDTIDVIQSVGLISEIDYRPALATRINYYSSLLKPEVQKQAFDIATQRLDPGTGDELNLPIDDRVKALNLAAQFTQYQYSRMELDQREYQQQFLSIIKERNKLAYALEPQDIITVPKPPNEGHLSGKVSVGVGYANDSLFTEVGYRPAYHSIDDPPVGHKSGEQLILLDVKGRYYEKNYGLKLQSFHLLDIISVTPRTMIIKPISWKFNTGLDQQILRDGEVHLVYRINGGAGVSYNSEWLGLSYGMTEVDFIYSDQLHDKIDFGIGLTAGTIKQLKEWWQVNFQLRWLYYNLSENCAIYRGDLFQTFTLSRNNAIVLRAGFYGIPGHIKPEISFAWNHYF
jgi:hypothetical protein